MLFDEEILVNDEELHSRVKAENKLVTNPKYLPVTLLSWICGFISYIYKFTSMSKIAVKIVCFWRSMKKENIPNALTLIEFR